MYPADPPSHNCALEVFELLCVFSDKIADA
jgi:hypothetical protein